MFWRVYLTNKANKDIDRSSEEGYMTISETIKNIVLS